MYTVAVLVERTLEALDADQLISLHEGLDEPVLYHLLRPVESSAPLLVSSLGGLGAEAVSVPSDPDTVERVQDALDDDARESLDASVALLRERGQEARGDLTVADPVEALTGIVKETRAAEAIILTEPHFVKEFFGLDWSARAKRALDVPTLHLIEHVPFDGQA